MLDAIRFTQGAVAKKDFVAALTHFKIQGGRITGTNGSLTLSSPIDVDIDVMPKAVDFIKAVQTCKDTITLHMTPAAKLAVKSGAFKANIDCVTEGFPDSVPEGVLITPRGDLLVSLRKIFPFIAEDASRQWARGILLRGQSAFATNNVVLAEVWLGHEVPCEVNIPKTAVAEFLRIGEEPTQLQVSDNSLTFHYAGGRWLKTQLYSTEWPDLSKVLDLPANPTPPPAGLWEALDSIKPFVNKTGAAYLLDGRVQTERVDEVGASAEVVGMSCDAVYHIDQLLRLRDLVTHIDLTTYPAPSIFYGEGVRGAIIGMRL